MDITNINLDACPLQYLSVGYVGETGARPVAFDFSAWAAEYGSGVLQLLLQRPGDAEPYPVVLDIDGTTATWTPDDTDTEKTGQGQAQLVYTVGGVIVKNAIFRVLIAPSLGAAGDPPEPYEDWLEQLTELAAETQQHALDAAESAESAETSADAAAGSAGAAAQSALDAEAAKSGAEAAEQTAQQAAALARAKAAEAAEAGQIAGENADYAQQQRIMADADAVDAHDSAESAAQSAEDAQAASGAAQTAASAAAASASAAAGSAADAASAVTEVETKGAEQITAINQAGTTQIAAVDAAGAVQVQAIEDKGEEVVASIPSDYTELVDEVSDLKSSFTNRAAGVCDVVDGVGDLDVADPYGNVLVRLADGEILTKKFDSSALKTLNEENGDADLDIADRYGNVLARFGSGNFETKNFRGFQYVTFSSETANYNGQSLTLTVDKTFRRGDRIVIHMERGAMPWDTGAAVSYYEGQNPIKTNWRGDCTWLEHTVMQDEATISAVYAANATGMPNGAVRLEVSLLGDIPVTPTVVSIKQDGSGDYTTLRGALDAIGTSANDVLNPYRIEIYPGTYNVMDDYTDEEIAAAAYDQTHFVGPKLLNGMQLVGIGRPHEVVISGTLDTTEWSSSIRGVVSTLNFQGNCAIENLTIKAENLRYCIHDDFQYAFGKMRTVRMKNIVFKASGAMSYSVPNTYGASAREGGTLLFAENCDFSYRAAIHTAQTTYNNSRYYLCNCKASQMGFGDIVDSADASKQNLAVLDSCDFQQILVNNWIVSPENYNPHVRVFGTITEGAMYQMMPSVLYDTSDVVHSLKLQLAVGTAVEKDLSASSGYPLQWKKATDVSKVNGVIVFNDDDTTYVQCRGYVRTDRLGLASVSNGDLIGIDANGAAVIVQDAANAYGRVAMVDAAGFGYVKLEV